jgi:hypothetical protein
MKNTTNKLILGLFLIVTIAINAYATNEFNIDITKNNIKLRNNQNKDVYSIQQSKKLENDIKNANSLEDIFNKYPCLKDVALNCNKYKKQLMTNPELLEKILLLQAKVDNNTKTDSKTQYYTAPDGIKHKLLKDAKGEYYIDPKTGKKVYTNAKKKFIAKNGKVYDIVTDPDGTRWVVGADGKKRKILTDPRGDYFMGADGKKHYLKDGRVVVKTKDGKKNNVSADENGEFFRDENGEKSYLSFGGFKSIFDIFGKERIVFTDDQGNQFIMKKNGNKFIIKPKLKKETTSTSNNQEQDTSDDETTVVDNQNNNNKIIKKQKKKYGFDDDGNIITKNGKQVPNNKKKVGLGIDTTALQNLQGFDEAFLLAYIEEANKPNLESADYKTIIDKSVDVEYTVKMPTDEDNNMSGADNNDLLANNNLIIDGYCRVYDDIEVGAVKIGTELVCETKRIGIIHLFGYLIPDKKTPHLGFEPNIYVTSDGMYHKVNKEESMIFNNKNSSTNLANYVNKQRWSKFFNTLSVEGAKAVAKGTQNFMTAKKEARTTTQTSQMQGTDGTQTNTTTADPGKYSDSIIYALIDGTMKSVSKFADSFKEEISWIYLIEKGSIINVKISEKTSNQ